MKVDLNAFTERLHSRATLMAEKEKVDKSFADRLFVNRTREVRQYLKDYKVKLIDEIGTLRYWHAVSLVEQVLFDADHYRQPFDSIERSK